MEIIDNLLWFPKYSIYLTDWCKAYLAVKMYSPGGLKEDNLIKIYQDVLLVWYAHHHFYDDPTPDPPRYHHLEIAYNLLMKERMLTHEIKQKLLLDELPSAFQQEKTSIKSIMLSLGKIFKV